MFIVRCSLAKPPKKPYLNGSRDVGSTGCFNPKCNLHSWKKILWISSNSLINDHLVLYRKVLPLDSEKQSGKSVSIDTEDYEGYRGLFISSHRRCSKNFANFTGKRLCWSLLFTKLQAFRAATLL